MAGVAVQNAESVAGKCAATREDRAVFREAVGAEEALQHGAAGAQGEFTPGWDAAVVVTRGGALVLAMRAGAAGGFVAGAVLPDSELMKHRRRVAFLDQQIIDARN